MDDTLLIRFQKLIAERTGINASQDPAALRSAIQQRIRGLALAGADRYFTLLADGSAAGRAEWNELATLITNGESHFFRDQGQMALIRDEILPDLIGRHARARRLRVWSAGCSTGEEPYSIAILLDEILPAPRTWDITILGTDINPAALARARRGRYGNWSFRTVDPVVKDRYFRRVDDAWEVREDIRSMVTFAPGNIHAARADATKAGGAFDLIICRNVFIYFDRAAVAGAVATFAGALADGGYLMTGHGELSGHDLHGLRARRFASSVIYQHAPPAVSAETARPAPVAIRPIPSAMGPARTAAGGAPPSASARAVAAKGITGAHRERPAPVPLSVPASAPASVPAPASQPGHVAAIEALMASGDYAAVIERGYATLREHPRSAPVLALVARALANRGRYDEAIARSREAIAADPLATGPYFLLAHIAEERGDLDEAKKTFRSILYIAPSSVGAYLHMADIHEREGDGARARSLRETALRLLETMDPAAQVDDYVESDARGLLAGLRRSLGAGGARRNAG